MTNSQIVSALSLAAFAVCSTHPMRAQGGAAFPASQQAFVHPETFRSDVLGILDTIDQPASGRNAALRAGLHSHIGQLRQKINALSPAQLSIMASYYDVSTFAGIAAELKTQTTKMKSDRAFAASSQVIAGTDLPTPDYGICPPDKGSDAQEVKRLVNVLLTVTAAATIAADTACSTLVEILGEGTNLPFCIVDAVVRGVDLAATKGVDDYTFCDGNIDSTRIDAVQKNTQIIDEDLLKVAGNVNTLILASVKAQNTANQVQSTVNNLEKNVNTLQTTVNGVAASVDTVQTSLDNLTATVKSGLALDLRLRIEQNLLQTGGAIILFQLPAAQGGYLGLVRDTVVDSIAKVQATGASTDTAASFLAAGDLALSRNQFKVAYLNYQKAYSSAASVLGGGELVR